MSKQEQIWEVPPLPLAELPAVQCGAGFDLLAGFRVLDLTGSIAGPYATMMLADMGAEVIKIERPGSGDDTRDWGPPFLEGEALWYLSVNRNKRSVALDYAGPAGLETLHRLAAACDVVVVNLLPQVARKLGVDAETMRGIRPDVVYVSITGFGLKGDRADSACYDLIAEGYSGVMDLTGDASGGPQKVGAPAADMLAGSDAAYGAVAALLARSRTGFGRVVDVALVDSMTRFLSCRIVPYLGSGELPRRTGGTDSVIAIYQAFETADRPITLGLGNDGIFRRFWTCVGQAEVADDPRFASNADRRLARAELVAAIQRVLLGRTREQWLGIFKLARVPAGPINSVADVAADPALAARGLFYRLEADGREIPQVDTGIMLDGRANVPSRPPPRLGADTDAVLGGLLGYDADRLAAMRQDQII